MLEGVDFDNRGELARAQIEHPSFQRSTCQPGQTVSTACDNGTSDYALQMPPFSANDICFDQSRARGDLDDAGYDTSDIEHPLGNAQAANSLMVDEALFDASSFPGLAVNPSFHQDQNTTNSDGDWERDLMQLGFLGCELDNPSWVQETIIEESEEIRRPRQTGTTTAEIRSQTKVGRRRRDYTKEEKVYFQKWITQNPKPDKTQKIAYARQHGLSDNQLQNLINNHRRRKNTSEVENKDINWFTEGSFLNGSPLIAKELSEYRRANCDEFPNHEQDIHMDVDTVSLPVSNKNIRQVVNKKPSYSSIEEYLKSPEEAVPFGSIRRASAESFRTDLSPLVNLPRSEVDIPRALPVSSIPEPSGMTSVRPFIINMPSPPSSIGSFAPSSVASSSYAGSFLSFASSASVSSRVQAKKLRRQSYMSKRTDVPTCSFCKKTFGTRGERHKHETDAHCIPQTFPCTFCNERFDSMESWGDHESRFHCQLQVTWFCLLDGSIDVKHCLFCDSPAPIYGHYEDAHDLHPCLPAWSSRTFSTRYDFMRHLVEAHEMSEDEVSFIKDGLDLWSVALDLGHNSGLWGCGYCGIIGADWEDRREHIKNHWKEGGPRITKMHPWSDRRFNLPDSNSSYIRYLRQGKSVEIRPWSIVFHHFELYEAAMMHIARLKMNDPPSGEQMEEDSMVKEISNAEPALSVIARLESRTKKLLENFTRGRRKHG